MLQIAEPPALPKRLQFAKLLPPVPEPEELQLWTPPLLARGQIEAGASSSPVGDLHRLVRLAHERYATIPCYTARLRRREQAGDKERREEILVGTFRQDPWSLHVKWVGEEGKDREAIYFPGRHGNLVHVLTAAGDVPLMPLAGRHIKLAPDSAVVKAISRQALADTGIGFHIDRFCAAVDAAEHGEAGAGTLTNQGVLRRADWDKPLEAVLQIIPAGGEPELPEGGERVWFFDLELHFPVLVVTHDPRGDEVEYYCFDQFTFPCQLPDQEFNPDKLWGR
jgi:hypothetical protein